MASRNSLLAICCASYLLLPQGSSQAQQAKIHIDAAQGIHRLSPLLAGACIEDVNHEIYGGLYSQMIFGESFQEPALASPIEGMAAYGGDWKVAGEILQSPAGEGNKIVAEDAAFADGEASVDVWFDDNAAGNAGLIIRTSQPGIGADRFWGYEIALDPERQVVRLGRHRRDFKLLQDVACDVPTQQWVTLRVVAKGSQLEIFVNGQSVLTFDDADSHAIENGAVGLRQFHRAARYRNLQAGVTGQTRAIPFTPAKANGQAVSRMWQPIRTGDAQAAFELSRANPFVGVQSQQIKFSGGTGEAGVANRGLNGWGMHFEAGKPYDGELYVRADEPCDLHVALENSDGSQVLAEQELHVAADDWTKLDFQLIPSATVRDGRFALKLRRPSAVAVGYAFLQSGGWGRFKDLPVRRDVAELLQRQGIRLLRYGGTMVNNDEYRWQKMIGPRATRPPYDGHWYDYSTNSWGIIDFMNFCEAAGFEYVPTFSMGETPESMAQFVMYAKAPADNEWGAKRARDGHPKPYRLKYLQLGNEERVDLDYAARFKERAEAIWKFDPDIQLIVGDFVYENPIADPQRITGSASGITTLDGQQSILKFAKAAGHEVWFDVHVWTDGPDRHQTLQGMFSFIDSLENLETGADFKVVVFEFNANNHDQRRAIGNALALHSVERDGRIPIALSANALQPDGQNDNGWDQGLLFLNPSQVWLQPPGYVTQMYSQAAQPRLVACEVAGVASLDANAKLSDDGKSLTCSIVNSGAEAVAASLVIEGYQPTSGQVVATSLAGPLAETNTAEQPERITPQRREWKFGDLSKGAEFRLEPRSVTTIEFN
ncbi:family 16 glycoside hydrolase [Lacipirellula sp.]|uniref:family 16 glycoside hydrolase n=1 Tax=Lacipirellula sp. TaxID=2691419 RepID=UPI003D111F53